MVTFLLLFVLQCKSITFTIDCSNKSGPFLPYEFLSVTVGVITEENEYFPFKSQELNILAQGLSPLYMRYGGTTADQLYYSINNGNITSSITTNNTYHLNLTLFSEIADFAQRNNWKFVFGLNEQTRTSKNEWNFTNSKQLLNAIKNSNKQNNNVSYVYAFELGNEPNLYKSHQDIGYIVVNPQQEAKDFATLFNLIQNIFNNTNNIPLLWGNDGADRANRKYTEQWAQSVQSMNNMDQIDALTFHQYYGSGKTFNLSDYYNVTILDSLIVVLQNITNISNKYFGSTKKIVFGETASSSGGGAPNITDTFIDGFMYLDKLGLSSIYGLHAVCRQIFYHGNYALIRPNKSNKQNLMVTPDYWTSYLFKNLVGNKVIYVEHQFEYGRYLRMYAFCTKTYDEGSIFNYNKGSITIMILNLYNDTKTFQVNFNGINNNNNTNDMSYDGFYLTPNEGIINSPDILLNGKLIKMMNATTFPKLEPINTKFGSNIQISGLSYAFIVALNVNASACL